MKQKHIHPLKFKNYFSYLYSNLTHTPLGQSIKNIYLFFRRYVLVGRIFRITRLLFIYTQTCAYILFLSTFLLILMPVLFCVLLVFILNNISLYRKYNKFFSAHFRNQSIVVTFSDNAAAVAGNDSAVKINVSDKVFFKNLKCAIKTKDKNYDVTLPYFYSLKRNVLNTHTEKVTYIRGAQN